MAQFASVIDLFAGPGGLGEGFSAYSPDGQVYPFHIEMSVEKEISAHKTLELRAFFRQFKGGAPNEYYSYLRGEITRDQLFEKYPAQSERAATETLGGPKALGNDEDDHLIHKRLGQLKKMETPWVVIGGPPCQAYSLVGRARNLGIKKYRPEEDKRHFLYEEYLKVLWSIKPEVFIMENVKGILSSQVHGQRIFPRILQDLSHPGRALKKRGGRGYRIFSLQKGELPDLIGGTGSDYIIRAENHGVPQSRHRVILLGVRDDIDATPGTLAYKNYAVTTKSTIGDLPKLRSGISRGEDSPEIWHKAICAGIPKVARGLKEAGLDVSDLEGVARKAARLRTRGGRFLTKKSKFRGARELDQWFTDNRLGGVVNHQSRGHMVNDLLRYMYCSIYAAQTAGLSPKAEDFPKELEPKHKNWRSGKFVDRFKVQSTSKPSSTITSHISKDGHYFIHYDPSQCRSLTVREAARLQTFPDNYFFEGNRTQQYVQVGNAVPPWLAKQIAEIVLDLLS